jgi:hypothetical protein
VEGSALLLLALLTLLACRGASIAVSEPELCRIIQEYLDQEPSISRDAVGDMLGVEGVELECRFIDKRPTCVAPVEEKLHFLVQAGKHSGTAWLDLTNKGWLVNNAAVYWSVPAQ